MLQQQRRRKHATTLTHFSFADTSKIVLSREPQRQFPNTKESRRQSQWNMNLNCHRDNLRHDTSHPIQVGFEHCLLVTRKRFTSTFLRLLIHEFEDEYRRANGGRISKSSIMCSLIMQDFSGDAGDVSRCNSLPVRLVS